jgi:4'-phosphopantetheinyl transferase
MQVPEAGFGALEEDEVCIWLFRPESLQDPLVREAAESLLIATDVSRCARFRFAEDRDRFLAARALERTVLAAVVGTAPDTLALEPDRHGKPRLLRPVTRRTLSFNLSHTRRLVACAVTWDREIGLDIEEVREAPLDVAERYFAPPEIAALGALDRPSQQRAFFMLWTLKESFLKAMGVGLTVPLSSFAVRLSPPGLMPYGALAHLANDWCFMQAAPTPTCQLALCASSARSSTVLARIVWLPEEAIVRAASCKNGVPARNAAE